MMRSVLLAAAFAAISFQAAQAQAPAVETLTRYSFQVRMKAARELRLEPPLPMFNYAELLVDTPPAAEAAPAAPATK